MSRQEAFNAMKSGKKITHQYFSKDEFYEIKDGAIIAEDGVNHTSVFWSLEQEWRSHGW